MKRVVCAPQNHSLLMDDQINPQLSTYQKRSPRIGILRLSKYFQLLEQPQSKYGSTVLLFVYCQARNAFHNEYKMMHV